MTQKELSTQITHLDNRVRNIEETILTKEEFASKFSTFLGVLDKIAKNSSEANSELKILNFKVSKIEEYIRLSPKG
jgi:hypothetical protein